ncbi:ubiquitin carboxyl-terminal hydrolase 1 [Lactuca sativa]|uniref:Ubiquitin carboxyl-terminal hydrolase n=1 Tax=Lactuca sativa TaxID=4236 RepID=A0A9R1V5F9_LACSA|nr:ubiquitin carboxyl-terminal hydrolase 1 [Lactuca sativa]KAJ0200060.1 hypothetical protein LSAT_V11C600322060 [Lactuca sativa]
MGKKLKKKTNRNAQKEKHFPTSSRNNISEKIPTMVVDGGTIEQEKRLCPHIETGINLDKVSSKITSLESPNCDDCREGVLDRRASKPRGKHNKKKGSGSTSDSKSIWVCLECGQFTCGGIGFPTVPHTHATRHSKQNHHPLAIQFANPNLRFCFPCNTLIPVQVSEENGEEKDAFSSVVKVLKTRPSSEKKTLDVEDVWFGNGSVITEVKSVNTEIIPENSGGFYMVKGLNNLGNTCFFNSILQNLLAMDKLRDHFMKLETPVGPLSVSIKKLFVKTDPSTIDKSIINPRPLFNSICTMASQFKGYQQQDSHELLRFLLDGLCNEECSKDKNVQKEHPTFVDALFGGQICSSVSCLECGHTSNVYEPYLDLSLPLPTKKSTSKKMPLVSKSKKPNTPPKRREKIETKVHKASDPATREDIMEKISGITITESGIPLDDCNGNSNSSDISSWLDYLEPTKASSDSWLDYLDPCSSNDHDMVSRNGIQDSGDGNEHIWEDLDEAPRVQESEILLLPYKELTSTSNGNEIAEEASDFDGFGGLFDEPEVEVVSGPSVKNNSDSDSDELDNSDCQVSVDKCLAYFTTTEILSKTDHAWQCEQCTKALLEQRTRLKNKTNGIGIGIPSDSGIEHSFLNGNGSPSIPSDSGVEDSVSNGVGNGNGNRNGNGVPSEMEERGSEENGGNSGLSSHHQSSVTDSNGHDSNGVEDEVDSSSVKVIRDASKRILISKVPPILTIHLKRLSQDARGRLSKLNGHVDFKDTIDLEPYMDPSCCKEKGRERYQYGLIGVVEHSGSARGGHYVAYVRGGLKDDWVWYHASDAHVRQVSLEDVFACEAYILFYEKM